MLGKLSRGALLVVALVAGFLGVMILSMATEGPWHELDGAETGSYVAGGVALAISLASLVTWLLLKGRARARRNAED